MVLLDIGLPTLNGVEGARQIRKLVPESKIIFLSQESSGEVVQEALKLGAWGYVVSGLQQPLVPRPLSAWPQQLPLLPLSPNVYAIPRPKRTRLCPVSAKMGTKKVEVKASHPMGREPIIAAAANHPCKTVIRGRLADTRVRVFKLRVQVGAAPSCTSAKGHRRGRYVSLCLSMPGKEMRGPTRKFCK